MKKEETHIILDEEESNQTLDGKEEETNITS